MCLTKQDNVNLLKESMRQKGPCSLPFIRRAAIILRFRDMASESKRRDRKRAKIITERLETTVNMASTKR